MTVLVQCTFSSSSIGFFAFAGSFDPFQQHNPPDLPTDLPTDRPTDRPTDDFTNVAKDNDEADQLYHSFALLVLYYYYDSHLTDSPTLQQPAIPPHIFDRIII